MILISYRLFHHLRHCYLVSESYCEIFVTQMSDLNSKFSLVATLIDINKIGLSFNCKNYDNPTPLLGLKRYLFCEYDRNVRPTLSHQTVSNVTIQLLPKILEFVSVDLKIIEFARKISNFIYRYLLDGLFRTSGTAG